MMLLNLQKQLSCEWKYQKWIFINVSQFDLSVLAMIKLPTSACKEKQINGREYSYKRFPRTNEEATKPFCIVLH